MECYYHTFGMPEERLLEGAVLRLALALADVRLDAAPRKVFLRES